MARQLGPADRGHLAVLLLVPTVLWQIGGLGVPLALTYSLARGVSPRELAAKVARPLVMQSIALVAIHGAIVYLVTRNSAEYIQVAGWITLPICPAALFHQYGLAILQGQQRFARFNVLRVLPTAVFASALLGLALTHHLVLWTAALAFCVNYLLFGLVTLRLSLRHSRSQDGLPSPPLKELVRFGLRGFVGSSSPVENYRVDQALIGFTLPARDLGLYVAALSFTNLPRFIAQSIGMVAYPSVASRSASAGRAAIWPFFLLSLATSAGIVALLEVVTPYLVPLFFGHEFGQAVPVTRLLLLNVLLIGARRVLSDGARGLGLPGLGSLGELVSLLTLLPCSLLLVSAFGLNGVAYALIISSCVGLAWVAYGLRSAKRHAAAASGPEAS